MSRYFRDKAGIYHEKPGYSRLWGWFGLSRASFLVMPRAMMHEMPDRWQLEMAKLLGEWDRTWVEYPEDFPPRNNVVAKLDNGKFTSWPSWVTNYRHPDTDTLRGIKRKRIRKPRSSAAPGGDRLKASNE